MIIPFPTHFGESAWEVFHAWVDLFQKVPTQSPSESIHLQWTKLCAPPNSYADALTQNVTLSENKTLKKINEVTRLYEVTQDEALIQ